MPAEVAARLAEGLRSPLKGSPPEPMYWDRDHMLLLGFEPHQVDALDAAAERARQKAVAIVKRIVRPATPEEVERFRMSRSAAGNFYIPNWKEEGQQLVAEFREEVRRIAGDAADEFLPGDGGVGMSGDGERVISFQDSPSTGWSVTLAEQAFSHSFNTHIFRGEELPAFLREIFNVEENQLPAPGVPTPASK